MKEKYGNIEYNGREYLLAFTLNVMEEIQEEYGSVESWGDLCGGGDSKEPNAKAVKFGFAAMINEGIEILDEKNSTETKPLTLKQVGRLISNVGLEKAAEALRSTVSISTDLGEDEKNA